MQKLPEGLLLDSPTPLFHEIYRDLQMSTAPNAEGRCRKRSNAAKSQRMDRTEANV